MSDEREPQPENWTDEFGRTWYRLELVHRQPESWDDVSDATLAFGLAVVFLVPALAILLASVTWGVPEWLGGPVAGRPAPLRPGQSPAQHQGRVVVSAGIRPSVPGEWTRERPQDQGSEMVSTISSQFTEPVDSYLGAP